MGKVQRPLVRWKIRTLGLCAQITQEALVDDFAVIGFVYAINLEGVGFVDEIEERGEGIAEANAAAAAMADIEDSFHFGMQGCLVVELWVFQSRGARFGACRLPSLYSLKTSINLINGGYLCLSNKKGAD